MSTSEVSPATPLDNVTACMKRQLPDQRENAFNWTSGINRKRHSGEALGITKSAMTMKMKGKVGWSVANFVKIPDFLGTTPSALMDDSIVSKTETGYTESA